MGRFLLITHYVLIYCNLSTNLILKSSTYFLYNIVNNRDRMALPLHNLVMALHKKWSFPLKISSVNVTKSTGRCGFGQISIWTCEEPQFRFFQMKLCSIDNHCTKTCTIKQWHQQMSLLCFGTISKEEIQVLQHWPSSIMSFISSSISFFY